MTPLDARGIINYLRRQRIKQGKTQADVCRASGIAKSSLTAWENHKTEPGLSSIMKWARTLDAHVVILNEAFSDVKTPQLREVTEYGVTFDKGPNAHKDMAPLTTEQICHWNRYSRVDLMPHLLIRTRLEVAEDVPFRRATNEEVTHWNNHIMAPYALGRGRE